MTALLTDEAVIEAARSHAQEETKLMPDSTERDEHLEYAERDFEAGARFARDHYEARLAEDAKVRAGLVEALADCLAFFNEGQGEFRYTNAYAATKSALAAAKERE